jgi:hypothetical protein
LRLIRITSTPWLQSRADLRALQAFSGTPHRVLRRHAGPWIAPALSPRLATPVALGRLVHALSGRMVVANPNVAARLPGEVAALARATVAARLEGTLGRLTREADEAAGAPPDFPRLALATRGSEDARRLTRLLERLPTPARDALLEEGAMRWAAAALLEPQELDVQLADRGGDAPTAPARFLAEPRYRLAVVAGHGTPPSWEELDDLAQRAPAVGWPPAREHRTWFATTLLVPDALAAAQMDDATLAQWAALTGRAGSPGRDRYWYADSWERFREPGRLVGHVTPQTVARSRPSGRGVGAAGDWLAQGTLALNDRVERGVAVPPGYCLVDCVGRLEVALFTS